VRRGGTGAGRRKCARGLKKKVWNNQAAVGKKPRKKTDNEKEVRLNLQKQPAVVVDEAGTAKSAEVAVAVDDSAPSRCSAVHSYALGWHSASHRHSALQGDFPTQEPDAAVAAAGGSAARW